MKRLEKLDRIEDVEIERPNIRINFRVDKTPGRVLVTLKDVSKQFGDNQIVTHATAEIDRGDKIALIGANGKGKSTLLRILAGVESFSGERIPGHNVEQSFYAQHQLEALNLNNTVLDEMKLCGSQKNDLELRILLGCFLFSGDDVDKKVRILSGGEKARVALAKTIISRANFLLLDEPTNHLDMHSCDLLIEALNKYEGSFILVSHDRYFISKTANKIWDIDNHKIREFKGNYEEWVDWQQRLAAEDASVTNKKIDKEAKPAQATPATNPKPPVMESKAPINKESKKEMQKLQRLFQELEEKMALLKAQKDQLEKSLAAPETYSDKQKFIQAETAYQQAVTKLNEVTSQYEATFDKIVKREAESLSDQ
jgi:ATP-binding cassette subfamily F protein 3